ncbi:hypothetical protein KVT40_000082 [Elsinoe batatas]|uniref:RanBD1 domain-containing protein n=1 Tax=Elsinoe batatas TaxID=2601811 RepID=A0A8K0L8M1_9PEZI|nr:hypothetical protein KVT40_000082 [Elsinoe batatas]
MPSSADETRASPEITEGEKPVREKLQKASIDATIHKDHASATEAATSGMTSDAKTEVIDTTDTARGRPQRKRSYDEATADTSEQKDTDKKAESKHGRKRSRDSTLGDEEAEGSKRVSLEVSRKELAAGEGTNGEVKPGSKTPPVTVGEEEVQAVVSPKSKRSRTEGAVNGDKATEAQDITDKDTAIETKEKSQPQPQTSSSAFAASGFGAFASSSSSGFGAVALEKKLSSFASPEPEDKPKETKTPATFGGALGSKSAFGSGTSTGSAFGSGTSTNSAFGGTSSGSAFGSSSGFGGGIKSGSVFGGGFGGAGGSKLSTFASSAGATFGGSKKPAKAFGAPAGGDEEEAGSEGEGDDEDAEKRVKSPIASEEEKRDERFYAQELETGEENEKTEYTCRAKLYNFVPSNPSDESSKKEWKERGLGTLRLNVQDPSSTTAADLEAGEGAKADDDEDKHVRARLVMRADGSHRVILNTPIKKELRFGSVKGEAPVGGYIYFMGSIDGRPKLELLQLKVRHLVIREKGRWRVGGCMLGPSTVCKSGELTCDIDTATIRYGALRAYTGIAESDVR